MKQLTLFLLSLCIISIKSNDDDSQLTATERFKKQNCAPSLPNLSVGDGNLTSAEELEAFKRDNEVFVLGISDS